MANTDSTTRKYSKIVYSQVVEDLATILESKEGALADLGKSTYGKTAIEMFSATSDRFGSWIESSFQNSWLESTNSEETGYLGARNLGGYSVRRPIPPKCGLGIALKRTGQYASVKVTIPLGAKFSVSGLALTAIDDMEFEYNRNDVDFKEGLLKLKSGRAVLAEGQFTIQRFFSDGTKFQEFMLPDGSVSDWFGTGDPNYTESDQMSDRIDAFTTVISDAGLIDNFTPIVGYEDKVYWRISRRGILDPLLDVNINDIDNFINGDNLTQNYTCIMSTANDGRVKLEFSDGVFGAIPYGEIQVKYFSTSGTRGNVLNVVGTKLSVDTDSILITQSDGSESDLLLDDLTFALTTDIRGGQDLESLASIKQNAPNTFNTFDSLGNGTSYRTYLRRIADVKYANAFGEDILSRNNNYATNPIDLKYANIIRFSVLKDLYREKDGKYYVTNPYEYYVNGYKVNGLMYLWEYDYTDLPTSGSVDKIKFSINEMTELMNYDEVSITRKDSNGDLISVSMDEFVSRYVPKIDNTLVPGNIFSVNLRPLDFIEVGSELESIMKSLNRKGYLTLGNGQHAYVPPTVHDLSMNIDLNLFEGSNFSDIKTIVMNKIYKFLRDNTKFSSTIFRSQIESLIQLLPEVEGVNVKFKSRKNGFENYKIDKLEWLSYATAQLINTTGLSDIDNLNFNLQYNYTPKLSDGTFGSIIVGNQTFHIGNQNSIREMIRGYYRSEIAYQTADGYVIRKDISERDVNKYCAYIWSIAMNEVYVNMLALFNQRKPMGDHLGANTLYHLLESIRTWYFSSGKLAFNDSDYISDMVEGSDNTLMNYIVYILDYIKLVRNILSPRVASQLIDGDGNISKYSSANEIVQFKLSSSDFKIKYNQDNYRSR